MMFLINWLLFGPKNGTKKGVLLKLIHSLKVLLRHATAHFTYTCYKRERGRAASITKVSKLANCLYLLNRELRQTT